MMGAGVLGSTLAAACMMGMALAAPPEQSSPNDPAAILKALNEIVSTHRYGGPGPKLELAADGMIVRTNDDGRIFRFRLRDIGEMSIDREGEAHVLLPCKDGALCVEWQASPGAAIQRSGMNVFSIYPADRGADVLRLFRELQAALAAKLVVTTADTAPLIS